MSDSYFVVGALGRCRRCYADFRLVPPPFCNQKERCMPPPLHFGRLARLLLCGWVRLGCRPGCARLPLPATDTIHLKPEELTVWCARPGRQQRAGARERALAREAVHESALLRAPARQAAAPALSRALLAGDEVGGRGARRGARRAVLRP